MEAFNKPARRWPKPLAYYHPKMRLLAGWETAIVSNHNLLEALQEYQKHSCGHLLGTSMAIDELEGMEAQSSIKTTALVI